MSLPRLSLRLTALVFAAFGVSLLVRPELMGKLGVELASPTGFTEIRAFYGGLELGLALFFAIASTRDEWLHPALFAQAVALGTLLLARLAGIVVDGTAEPVMLLFAAIEAVGVVLAWAALRTLRPVAMSAAGSS